jgi:hypothetical protein
MKRGDIYRDSIRLHYGLQATTNNLGVAHENGDVEQEHRQFKRAVDQALRARGSRDFSDRAAYARFLAISRLVTGEVLVATADAASDLHGAVVFL